MDWGEVEEALLLVKEGIGKGKEGGKGKGAEPLPFLEKVEEDKGVWWGVSVVMVCGGECQW